MGGKRIERAAEPVFSILVADFRLCAFECPVLALCVELHRVLCAFYEQRTLPLILEKT